MKLSDQLRLLLEMEDRLSALERAVYRKPGEGSPPEVSTKPSPSKPVEKKEKKKEIKIEAASIDIMSKTEMAQIAVSKGHSGATRAVHREDLKSALLSKSVEEIEDPLESVRENIYYFITKVQPSLRQTLRCSCDCKNVCPMGQVIDCWTSNKQKIEELTT